MEKRPLISIINRKSQNESIITTSSTFKSNSKVILLMTLKLKNDILLSDKFKTLQLHVNSSNNELNTSNNHKSLILYIHKLIGLQLQGELNPSTYVLKNEEISKKIPYEFLDASLYISNRELNDAHNISLYMVSLYGNMFNWTFLQEENGIKCDFLSIKTEQIIGFLKNYPFSNFCFESECTVIKCLLNTIRIHKVQKVSVKINISHNWFIEQLELSYGHEIITRTLFLGMLKIDENSNYLQEYTQQPEFIEFNIKIMPLSSNYRRLGIWIYLVSVMLGVLLLMSMIFILLKTGHLNYTKPQYTAYTSNDSPYSIANGNSSI